MFTCVFVIVLFKNTHKKWFN